MTTGIAPSYEKLTDLDELRNLARNIMAEKKPFGYDVETGYDGESREKGSLHREENFLVAYQFTNSMNWGRLVPLRFNTGENCDNYVVAEILWELHHATDDEGLPLGVAHAAIAELRWMSKWFLQYLGDHPVYGKAVRKAKGYFPFRSCTMLESFVLAESQHHDLKSRTENTFGHVMRKLDSLFPNGLTAKARKCIRFNELDPDDPEVIAYGCEDAVWCLAHHLFRYPKVKDSTIYQVEMAVLPVIAEMADNGVYYDWNLMREFSRKAHDFMELYRSEVIEDFEELAGEPIGEINFNSSKQFADLLYNKCGIPVRHWTPKKNPRVDAKIALPDIAKKYPAVAKYLNLTRVDTLCTNFLDNYEAKHAYAEDGRAHPILLQHGTVTGRFSCEDMNYQQSPKKYRYALRDNSLVFECNYRDVICAAPGNYILGFDYSQIELRVVAGEANEPRLLEAFANGEDVHSLTAALMLGIPLESVTKDDRAVGKTMNFALVYGMSEDGLADRLGITLEEAAVKFQQYFAAYPRIKQYMDQTRAQAEREGYVTTKFGRKVTIWELQSPNPRVRAGGRRTAGNAPIQGSATGDYVKISMVRAMRALKDAGLDRVKLIMNIHDALEFEVPDDIPPGQVIKVLQPAIIWDVPGWPEMKADWHIGERWGSVLDVDVSPEFVVTLKAKDDDAVLKPAEVEVLPAGSLPESEEGLAEVHRLFPEEPYAPAQLPSPEFELGHLNAIPRTVVVTTAHQPCRDDLEAFRKLLNRLPGHHTVVLDTPGNEKFTVNGTYGLDPSLEPQVSIIFGGAYVRYDLEPADLSALVSDIEL